MPELPEVETCRLGLLPHILNHPVSHIIIRRASLRWPIPAHLNEYFSNRSFIHLNRRGKYLILSTQDEAHLLIHLGMSGRLYWLNQEIAPQPHDHVDIIFKEGHCLRYQDPRRFGAILTWKGKVDSHPLLSHLGPEPLTEAFNIDYLYSLLRTKKQSIKMAIMDSHIVVGVGNIYANEALFRAGIHPKTPSNTLTQCEIHQLIKAIQDVLNDAITAGGTTLKDFISVEGKPGYFQQALAVYGRGGLACKRCTTPLETFRLGQRTTVACPNCQALKHIGEVVD